MVLGTERAIVERYYRAMEAGSKEEMNRQFTEDAV